MIGQQKLLSKIDKMIENGFPRYIIIVGASHSGKRTIAKHIAKKLDTTLVISDIKVDNVRETINLAYKQSEPTIYLFPDTDKMSIAAKNAMLKITEEPPRKAYFIMTLEDINNTLGTLKSRGTILQLDPYSPEELLEYARALGYNMDRDVEQTIADICTNPGEVGVLLNYNVQEFYNYAETILDNIGIVNGANAFKITNKFAYKEEDEGWDVYLMLRAIIKVAHERMMQKPDAKYLQVIKTTGEYLNQLKISGINKSATIDMWILQMRGILCEGE